MEKEMEELISIIIPVYNVQEYLVRCLNSIACQTYRNYEVILVDDGSKDDSGAICDSYAKKDARVKVCHIDNQGVGNARNHGLSQMRGEWFCFLDADDWLEPDYLMKLYRMTQEHACDVAACLYVRDNRYRVGIEQEEERCFILSSARECVRNFISSDLSMSGMVWNKLYRTETFGELRFDTGIKVNEDCLYTLEVMKRCSKACITSLRLYHWFYRSDSACHARPTDLDFRAADVFLFLLSQTEEMKDTRVEYTLKRNYVKSALNTLFYVKHSRKDPMIRTVLARLKNWKSIVWPGFERNQKIKYMLVVYFPVLLPIVRKQI